MRLRYRTKNPARNPPASATRQNGTMGVYDLSLPIPAISQRFPIANEICAVSGLLIPSRTLSAA